MIMALPISNCVYTRRSWGLDGIGEKKKSRNKKKTTEWRKAIGTGNGVLLAFEGIYRLISFVCEKEGNPWTNKLAGFEDRDQFESERHWRYKEEEAFPMGIRPTHSSSHPKIPSRTQQRFFDERGNKFPIRKRLVMNWGAAGPPV